MKIKKGDNVQMRTGKDRGKQGKVLRVLPERGRIQVDGLNTVKKHQRPRKEGEQGQILTIPRAVDVSNVTLVCTQCKKTTRVGKKQLENGKRVRVCKRCASEV